MKDLVFLNNNQKEIVKNFVSSLINRRIRELSIVVDMDDVLADFNSELLSRYNKKYNDNLEYWEEWDMSKCVKPECGNKIFDIMKEPKLFRNLSLIKGALEGFNELLKISKVIIVSSAEPYSMEDKYYWVQEHFPNFDVKTRLFFGGGKGEFCPGYDIIIDDAPKNILAFNKAGKLPIIFDKYGLAKYNHHLDNNRFVRTTNWNDLIILIKWINKEIKQGTYQ